MNSVMTDEEYTEALSNYENFSINEKIALIKRVVEEAKIFTDSLNSLKSIEEIKNYTKLLVIMQQRSKNITNKMDDLQAFSNK
jgi:hypothetical protein